MGLKIQYASDLHLEFPLNSLLLEENPLEPVGDILVLAGDVMPFAELKYHEYYLDLLSQNFKTTFWIPGNHEYYRFDLAKKSGVLHEEIRENVFLVNNTFIQQNNVKLIFSTLWSKIKPQNRNNVESGMSDFYLIRNQGEPFTADHYNQLHQESIEFIKNEVSRTTEDVKIAVFTHHCPTLINYPPQWLGSSINDGFATELSDFIENSAIDYWCYGHHHTNTPDFTIGKTKMICNQLGYAQQNEHRLFDRGKFIEL